MTAMATAPAISVPNESHFRAALAPSSMMNQPPTKISETSLWMLSNSDKRGERRRNEKPRPLSRSAEAEFRRCPNQCAHTLLATPLRPG